MIVSGRNGTGKTNLLANFILSNKDEYVQRGKKGESRYIRCDNLIVCSKAPHEPSRASQKPGSARLVIIKPSISSRAEFKKASLARLGLARSSLEARELARKLIIIS